LSTCQLVNSSTNKLTYLNITAVDSKGRIVPGFNEPITVSVEGAATLYSLDNHDHYTSDLFHGVSTKNMKNGRMQVILRGKGEPGAITIKATTPKLKLKKKITK
jgi:beta-galactosidase